MWLCGKTILLDLADQSEGIGILTWHSSSWRRCASVMVSCTEERVSWKCAHTHTHKAEDEPSYQASCGVQPETERQTGQEEGCSESR